MTNYKKDAAQEFANRMKALGFTVYIAKSGGYGFVTDETEARVLSFGFSDGGSLGGNYGPPSKESGTSWRIDKTPYDLRTAEDVRSALASYPPAFCGKGWTRLTSVKEYLAMYDSSSQYEKA